MRRLIRFLVEQELAGAVGDTGEYTIGIRVFDRDARSYTTCEVPIVRVQVGRLRARLQAYYAGGGAHAELRFSIPIGSYMPTISRHGDSAGRFPHEHLLAVTPLLAVTHDPQGIAFSQGLNEELAYQLFNAFGHKIVSHTFALAEPALQGRPAGVSHVLEGSVRVHGEQIRASLRLVDAGAGCIAWSEQFDLCGPFAIALQEQLALAICSALKRYFAHGWRTIVTVAPSRRYRKEPDGGAGISPRSAAGLPLAGQIAVPAPGAPAPAPDPWKAPWSAAFVARLLR